MTHNKDNETFGFVPKKKQVAYVVTATMLIIFSTAISITIVFNVYFNVSAAKVEGILLFASILFSLINIQVTRGSFLCASILKYYTLALALISAPALFLGESLSAQVFYLMNMASLLGAFFLIRGETYQEYVEFRNTLFADIKEAREA
ncbi:MAG: hypothetical protein JKY01_01495, partial [Pseudomonadales bacterium]|nr:hypothetical protein [Pseudomonadales bacterium]